MLYSRHSFDILRGGTEERHGKMCLYSRRAERFQNAASTRAQPKNLSTAGRTTLLLSYCPIVHVIGHTTDCPEGPEAQFLADFAAFVSFSLFVLIQSRFFYQLSAQIELNLGVMLTSFTFKVFHPSVETVESPFL